MPPVHGAWCNAVTWPTTCLRCEGRVFFYKCDCGCKVFFDELGPPWPRHDCEPSWERNPERGRGEERRRKSLGESDTVWARNLERRRGPGGAVTVKLRPGIFVQRPPTGEISSEVVATARRRASQPDPIRRAVPGQQADKEVVGVLRDLERRVDVYRKLEVEQTDGAAAALRDRRKGIDLGRGVWGRVTLHEQAADVLNSYTFWVPSDLLQRMENARGVTVAAKLRAFRLLDGRRTWVCHELKLPG